ncbi:MAG TPA: phospholipase, partial [Alphaproteobacteria bacterium]|nr:phospholipase [Alphaproteobacteria bacterium]
EPDDGLPLQLGPFLTALVEKRPELTIYLLLWDYSVIYALEREPVPSLNLDWKTPRQIKVCLDDILPLGGSHHQKIVVIDDAVAFCGGIDLTIRRWDTSAHEPDDERRRDPGGESYAPFHDLQMCVDGDCAAKLGELVRARWHAAACHAVSAVPPEQRGDPWPDALKPDFSDTKIAIARTIPAIGDEPEVREIEALYIDMIGTAEQFIYIENQFLTSDSIASSLAQRLQQKPELEVLFVSPEDHPGWLEARSMKAGRIRFMQ